MNNEILWEQYKKTGDIMDILHDHDVLREMIKAEDACMGSIGAGFPAYSNNPQPVDPDKLSQVMFQVRLQSVLFTELETMMSLANLGAGTEAAITEARSRIRQQLVRLTEEQRMFFDDLVAEELAEPLVKPVRAQLKAKIYLLLPVADWNAVWQAATNALEAQWVDFMESSKSA
jgi:hypothetical protein